MVKSIKEKKSNDEPKKKDGVTKKKVDSKITRKKRILDKFSPCHVRNALAPKKYQHFEDGEEFNVSLNENANILLTFFMQNYAHKIILDAWYIQTQKDESNGTNSKYVTKESMMDSISRSTFALDEDTYALALKLRAEEKIKEDERRERLREKKTGTKDHENESEPKKKKTSKSKDSSSKKKNGTSKAKTAKEANSEETSVNSNEQEQVTEKQNNSMEA